MPETVSENEKSFPNPQETLSHAERSESESQSPDARTECAASASTDSKTAEIDPGSQQQTKKKVKRSTARILASDKNIIRKKLNRLMNLKKTLDALKKIRRRGYESKALKDGRVIHNKLTSQEKIWYGNKIHEVEEEIFYLSKEISELKETFDTRVKRTKQARKEKLVSLRKEKKIKERAKTLLKNNVNKILADSKNGKTDLFNKIKEKNMEGETDPAVQLLAAYFEEEMKPVFSEFNKDSMLKDEFLSSTLKLICAG